MKYEIFEIIWICCLKICSKIDFSKILEILHETVISCESGPARQDSFFRNFLILHSNGPIQRPLSEHPNEVTLRP